MIGPELVRVRRRGDKLSLIALSPPERERAREMAAVLLDITQSLVGATHEEVQEAWSAVERSPKEEKLFLGIQKLVEDASEFGQEGELPPQEVRRDLFLRASDARRRALEGGEPFSREAVVEATAGALGVSSSALEEALFSDLKGAARLRSAPALSAEALVVALDRAQLQGVLLRAIRVVLTIRCRSVTAYRAIFQKLKFRQLLFSAELLPDGRHRLVLDGPFSMFEGVTKYGLRLALMVPLLEECEEVHLTAELRWGKERRPLTLETQFGMGAGASGEPEVRPELAALIEALSRRHPELSVEPAELLLHVPGVGLILPDLVLRAPGKPDVYFELLGHWSRDAVWKRVEWAEAAPEHRVIFAASSRLRVSEAVLPESSSSSLYVFKGTLSPKEVEARWARLAEK